MSGAERTVATWNLDGWHTVRDAQLRLLEGSGAQVALLQEVTPASLARLRDAGWIGASALELLPDDHTERGGVAPRFSCAVLVRGEVELTRPRLIAGATSPARAIAADLALDGPGWHAVSAALPPGSMWGRAAKVGQAEALAAHLRSVAGPCVVGMDRNGPKFERWEASETVWWREDPAAFFSDDAAHGCRDVLRRWYAARPDEAAAARHARPDGPMATTYVERRADPPIRRRYDVLMATEDLEVMSIDHRYNEATDAGSDHALVITSLRAHCERVNR